MTGDDDLNNTTVEANTSGRSKLKRSKVGTTGKRIRTGQYKVEFVESIKRAKLEQQLGGGGLLVPKYSLRSDESNSSKGGSGSNQHDGSHLYHQSNGGESLMLRLPPWDEAVQGTANHEQSNGTNPIGSLYASPSNDHEDDRTQHETLTNGPIAVGGSINFNSDKKPVSYSNVVTDRTYEKHVKKPVKKISMPKRPKNEGQFDVHTWSKLKPKRPLSAYNFFFRREREKIMEGLTAEERKERQTRDAKELLAELTRTISQRWKNLDKKAKAKYKELQWEDRERYVNELEIMEQKITEMKEEEGNAKRLRDTSISTNSSSVVGKSDNAHTETSDVAKNGTMDTEAPSIMPPRRLDEICLSAQFGGPETDETKAVGAAAQLNMISRKLEESKRSATNCYFF